MMPTIERTRSSRYQRGGTVLLALGLLCAAPACTKDDPIITGHRDAGAQTETKVTSVTAAADKPIVDAPNCATCAETLSTDTERRELCRLNTPKSSTRLLNEVVDCVCYDKCTVECSSYCSGSTQEPDCSACILAGCIQQYNACTKDAKPSP